MHPVKAARTVVIIGACLGCSSSEKSNDEVAPPAASSEQREGSNVKNPFAKRPNSGTSTPKDLKRPPKDALATESGLVSKVLEEGTGKEHPEPEDLVTVKYTGWTSSGEMFDTSDKRGGQATFPLAQMIPGWVEGVALMAKGEKRRLWIPANLAYGGAPTNYKFIPGTRPLGDLVFDIELVGFEEGPRTPERLEPPKDAEVTKSGLASKVLKKGGGGPKPTTLDKVTVHFTGWTASGERFDSSVLKGRPATFPLNNTLKGWSEGIALMKVGEKRRFWVPAKLAYGEAPEGWKYSRGARPMGPLIFDIELLDISEGGRSQD